MEQPTRPAPEPLPARPAAATASGEYLGDPGDGASGTELILHERRVEFPRADGGYGGAEEGRCVWRYLGRVQVRRRGVG